MAEEEHAGGENRRHCSEGSLNQVSEAGFSSSNKVSPQKTEYLDRCWASSGPNFLSGWVEGVGAEILNTDLHR